jgi:hypothetical protein
MRMKSVPLKSGSPSARPITAFMSITMLLFVVGALVLVVPEGVRGECDVPAGGFPHPDLCRSVWYNNSYNCDKSRADWMAQIPDDVLISELTIPGTHESHCFWGCSWWFAGPECFTCQSMHFGDQLVSGIRGLDVRLRHYQDELLVWHGICTQCATLHSCSLYSEHGIYCECGGILPACVEFLQAHPTETILLRLRETCVVQGFIGIPIVSCTCHENSKSFCEAIEEEIASYAPGYVYQWPQGDCAAMPTLGEVRGKIVILQDFQGDYEVGPYAWWGPGNYFVGTLCSTHSMTGFGDGLGIVALDGPTGELFTFGVSGLELSRLGHVDTGHTFTSVCSGDFTAPGQVAVTSASDDQLRIYDPHALHLLPAVYPTGEFPMSARTLDFDSDGLQDIVVANFGECGAGPGTLRLFRNTGRGFEWEDLAVGEGAWEVTVADLNGDEFPDLATTHCDGDWGLSVWINNAGSSLDLYQTVCQDTLVMEAIAGDFTGDGLDDLVVGLVVGMDGYLRPFRNTGTGMAAGPKLDIAGYPRGLATADVDNDGDLDLFAAEDSAPPSSLPGMGFPGPGACAIHLNDGGLRFPEHRTMPGWLGPYALVAQDFDGDSDVDLAALEIGPSKEGDDATQWGRNRVSIMRNQDDGATWSPGKALGPYWPNLHIQDDYVVTNHLDKYNTILQFSYETANVYPMDELCLNFLSGIDWQSMPSCDQTPNFIANDINWMFWNDLKHALNYSSSRDRLGVVMSDYPGPGLIDVIIGSNKFGQDRVRGEFYGPTGRTLPGVSLGDVVWGDYDSDGDLDFLLTGLGNNDTYLASVYRNDGGTFTDINAGLSGVQNAAAAWGDYDNDGDLDLLVTGYAPYLSTELTCLYCSNAGTFEETQTGLPGVSHGSVAWGDFDNDGDQDILLTGIRSGTPSYISRIYRNDEGSFEEIGAELPGTGYSSAAWGDYDGDGDLDVLLTGSYPMLPLYGWSRIFRNESGSFVEFDAGLVGVLGGSAAWGDYDGDGDLDILLTGKQLLLSSDTAFTGLYLNDAGEFVLVNSNLPPVADGSAAWGDYDNDGNLDVALNGITPLVCDYETSEEVRRISRIYRNDGESLRRNYTWLLTTSGGSGSWGDYDSDGDLDIAITGQYQFHEELAGRTNIYENTCPDPNTPPSVPTNLSAASTDSTVTFTWDVSSDSETPTAALSYNLRVGTTPGGSEVMSPMADVVSGHRLVPQLGNVQQRTSWTLKLAFGTYYWSVQAIDSCFDGSAFAEEQVLNDTPVENAFYATFVDEDSSVRLRWLLPDCPSGQGVLIYRATSPEGPYRCITSEPLPDVAHGSYIDDTAWPGATFWYELRALLPSGEELLATDIRASVSVPGSLVAGIRHVAPNPAHGQTTIAYSLPPGWRSARLAIHDVAGRVVTRLDPEDGAAGWMSVDWDGTAGSGQKVASGVYFVRLEVDGVSASERLVLLR